MDDFSLQTLQSSKDEWVARLINILTPQIISGFTSIFMEAKNICREKQENEKYLLTMQNLIMQIPKWNSTIINNEKMRIMKESNCSYLEDLLTCVNVIQLKQLSAIRVGQKQKKIDINIPKLDIFIHKVYINSARKLYKNVYLYDINLPALQIQKNNREIEILIQTSILDTLRENIPVDAILSAYLDETIEEDVIEEIKKEVIEPPVPPPPPQPETPTNDNKTLSFNDIDSVLEMDTNEKKEVVAPKTLDRLEEISVSRAFQRKLDEEDNDEEDRIQIHSDEVPLSFDSLDGSLPPSLEENKELSISDSLALLDIEELA